MSNRRGGFGDNPPFIVNVRLPRELEDFAPWFTGLVLDELEAGAARNEARAIFAEMTKRSERLLDSIVAATAEIATFFIDRDRVRSSLIPEVIAAAAKICVDGILVDTIQRNQHDFQNTLTQAQVDSMRDYQREMEGTLRDMEDYYNRDRRGGGGRVGNRVDNRDWRGGGNQRYDDRDDRDYPVRRRGGNGDSVWGRENSPAGTDGQGSQTMGNRVGRVARVSTLDKIDQNEQRHQARGRAPVKGTEVIDGVVFMPASDEKMWPKVTDRSNPWLWVLVENGDQYRPAYRSDWKVSYEPSHPRTTYYNPQTHVLFHVRSVDKNGVVRVTEFPMQRNDSMNEYLDHELDPNLRLKATEILQRQTGKVDSAWKLTEQLRPNPESPLATGAALGDSADPMAVRPVKPDDFILTTTLGDGLKRAVLKLKVENPKLVNDGFELYSDRMELTELVNPNFNLLQTLGDQVSYKELFKKLIDIRGQEELVTAINKRMTAGVNAALRQNMGLVDWSIDSYLDDLGDLLTALDKSYGPKTVETFEDNAETVISMWLSHFGEEEMDEVRTMFDLPEEAVYLVWRERSSMTYLPVSSSELSLPVGNGMMVTAAAGAEIHKTIEAVFDRTPDVPVSYHGRYMTTTDGVVYELVRGFFNHEAFLVYNADFALK